MIIVDNFSTFSDIFSIVSAPDAARYNGNYWVIPLTTNAERGLRGEISIPVRSAIYINSRAKDYFFDSQNTFTISIGPVSTVLTLDDPLLLGAERATVYNTWVNKFLGVLDPGNYHIDIRGVTTGESDYAYIDAIIAVPFITSAGTGWIEDDDPRILYNEKDAWGRFPASTVFPYDVVGQTGNGSTYNANIGHSCSLAINVGAGESFDIYTVTTAGSGRLRVYIENVLAQTIDLYSATTAFRVKTNIPISAGDHYVRFQIDAVKNAASSGFQCEIDGFYLGAGPTDEERERLLADYVASLVRFDDGGMRIAHDSTQYNQDNDATYGLISLMYAYKRYGNPVYAAAVKRALQWLWNIQDGDGSWHWGYLRSDGGVYTPTVNSYYIGVGITGLKTIDAPQATPIYALWLYAIMVPEDRLWVNSVKAKFLLAVDRLIADNYDNTNGFIYSSYQYFPAGKPPSTTPGWYLYEAQYSAGQADVWLGLMAAYAFSGNIEYKTIADGIKNNFDTAYYIPAQQMYSVGLFGARYGAKTQDTTYQYPFAQGWCPWVFPDAPNAINVINTMISWIQPDGYSIMPPPPNTNPAETANTAWLLMGLAAKKHRLDLVPQLKRRLKPHQRLGYPAASNGYGAALFSVVYLYPYQQTSTWCSLGWGGQQQIMSITQGPESLTGRGLYAAPPAAPPSAAYIAKRASLSRQPCYLVTTHLDKCMLTFGTAPCTGTGAPCYKTLATCKSIPNYAPLADAVSYISNNAKDSVVGRQAKPFIDSIKISPSQILTGEAITINGKATITFFDGPDEDLDTDPHRISPVLRGAPGGTEPIAVEGTYWGRWLTRNKHHKNRLVTIHHGFADEGFGEGDFYEVFRGLIDGVSLKDSRFTLTAKALLALTVSDIPQKAAGLLGAPIGISDISLTLQANTGTITTAAGAISQFAQQGLIRVSSGTSSPNIELIGYTGITVTGGVTTFTGLMRGLHQNLGWSFALAFPVGAQVTQAEYLSGPPTDIAQNLLMRSGIPSLAINSASFDTAKTTWLNGINFAATIVEPVKISELIKELREQAGLAIWQGDDQRIHALYIDAIQSGGAYKTLDESRDFLRLSTTSETDAAQRITRAIIHYDQIARLTGRETDGYQRAIVYVDANAEDTLGYGDVRPAPRILSRWIQSFITGEAHPKRIVERRVKRYVDGGTRVRFKVEIKDGGLELGEIFNLVSTTSQNANGGASTARYIVTSKEHLDNDIGAVSYVADYHDFIDIPPPPPSPPPPPPVAGYAIIAGGYINGVAGSSTERYAYNTNSWTAGTSLGQARIGAAAAGNSTLCAFRGGTINGVLTATTERYTHATSSLATGVNLSETKVDVSTCGNATFAVYRGGYNGVAPTGSTAASEKYIFATDAGSSAAALSAARTGAASAGNTVSGFTLSGSSSGTLMNNTDRYTYATETSVAGAALAQARQYLAGAGNTTRGIFAGGFNPNLSSAISMDYSTFAVTSATSLTVVRRMYAAAGDNTAGLFASGPNLTSCDLYTYATNVVSIAAALSATRQYHAAASSVVGGH